MSQAQVLAQGAYSEAAQQNFTSQFGMENPNDAISTYAKIMHEHTKTQLNTATSSARRRSQGISPSLTSGLSVESVSSNGS
ncbi:uncharacterized protein BDZ99DRAFT_458101 [Mytilinidion resinicola]|uniref:Uncharacterized protein n=1 Tax=Mytilinidion resinicola TaxID=574789 RepID=A0A6A6Z7J8_9PEZI|nr:uncharacterized protein BDZ99DRAFT_458101 [Mytilinidion resinicola]KAF2816207.1 hypothetical protein BDZ99DRAFT_458101 [Mytilinidion resinicola]